jgi:general secretion pathway protein A
MDTAPFLIESPDSGMTPQISPLLASASPVAAHAPSSPAALGIAEIEERIAVEMAIAPAPSETAESGQESAIAVEEFGADQSSEAAVDSQPPSPADEQKPAVTNLLSFYGLQQQPFDVTPDPAYLYFSPSHRAALTSLKEGIEHFRGFMMLVADPGMGKTTLLNKLMEELAESARIVFLFQTQCTSRELLCFILNELEVDHTGMDVVAMHRALNQALLEEMLRGRRFVLVVDEAQNLSEPVLETIRLLSDFETTHSKLIQIVLAGQPQLADSLMRPTLVQLRQRIAALSNLKALSPTEVAEYVEHRLRAAGWNGKPVFTSEALETIAQLSDGVPRSINNLCFNSLLEGFHRLEETINSDIVKEVSERFNLEAFARRLQPEEAAQLSPSAPDVFGATQLARVLASALMAEVKPAVEALSEAGVRSEASALPTTVPQSKPEVVLTGNITEKVRSQSWSKCHEYRILVTLEREPVSGLPVADHYYCCSMYVDEPQAAGLEVGKPVRIKLVQD